MLSALAFSASLQASQWKAPRSKSKKKNPYEMTAESIKKGSDLYVQECEECHGETGKGDGPKSGDIEVEMKDLLDPQIIGQTDGALFWKIKVGKRPMPSYKKLLTKEERWHVVNFIRSLKDKRGK